jgi:hypothetical protein
MSEHHHHGTTEATADGGAAKGRFEPKQAVQLAPPKSDPIGPEALAKCTGRLPFIAFGLLHRALMNGTLQATRRAVRRTSRSR